MASLAPAKAEVGAVAKADQNSVELVASLAPAKAEVGAVAKADQQRQILVRAEYRSFSQYIRSILSLIAPCLHIPNPVLAPPL